MEDCDLVFGSACVPVRFVCLPVRGAVRPRLREIARRIVVSLSSRPPQRSVFPTCLSARSPRDRCHFSLKGRGDGEPARPQHATRARNGAIAAEDIEVRT